MTSRLAERARAEGLTRTGQRSLLAGLGQAVMEGLLEADVDARVGYARHERASGPAGNAPDAERSERLLTDVGAVEISMNPDRNAGFDPQVRKPPRRLSEADGLVVSLAASRPIRGQMATRLRGVYGARGSPQMACAVIAQVDPSVKAAGVAGPEQIHPVTLGRPRAAGQGPVRGPGLLQRDADPRR